MVVMPAGVLLIKGGGCGGSSMSGSCGRRVLSGLRRVWGRRWVRVAAGTAVVVPAAAVAGAAAYIAFRVHTKPPERVIKPLINEEGALIMNDGEVMYPPPSAWQLLCRVLELLRLFLPLAVRFVFMAKGDPVAYDRWLQLLLEALQEAGPAFVKAGQWACTRHDLFGAELRDAFEPLFCDVRVHGYQHTASLVESELQRPLGDVFESLEREPIGSGSIGQVHVGILKGSGRKVAVKVMHPNVIETISKDFFIINWTARFVDRWCRSLEHYDLRTLSLAWTSHLAAQLDFRVEGENLLLFRENFRGCDYMAFPEPLFYTQRLLVEEFVEGHAAFPDFMQAQDEHVKDVLAGKGLNTWCHMLMRDNFVHGDMHPGNFIVNTSNPNKPTVTMIDVGIAQKFTPQQGKLSYDLMDAFVQWNPDLAANTILAMGAKQTFATPNRFREDMRSVFDRYRPVNPDTEGVISSCLQEVFAIIRSNYVTLDPEYTGLLFAVLILESLIMNLNPDFNIVRHCAPWMVSEGCVSRNLTKHLLRAARDKMRQKIRVARLEAADALRKWKIFSLVLPASSPLPPLGSRKMMKKMQQQQEQLLVAAAV